MRMQPMPKRLDWSDVCEVHLDPQGKSYLKVYDEKRDKHVYYRVSRWVAQLAKNEAQYETDVLRTQLRDMLGVER